MNKLGIQEEDERIIRKFALIPIILKNKIFWLKFIKIKQRYRKSTDGFSEFYSWINIEFIEDKN